MLSFFFSLYFLRFTFESSWVTQKYYTCTPVLNTLSLRPNPPFCALLCETVVEPYKHFSFDSCLDANLSIQDAGRTLLK